MALMKVSAGALFWFRDSADYERMRSLAEDGDTFFSSYSQWLQAAEKAFKQMQKTGRVIKVEADIDDYISWCNHTGRSINSKSRVAYANAKAFEKLRR